MPGATLQLAGVGTHDTYLTANPELNHFKYRYFRYVNFATEVVPLLFSEGGGFGKKFTAEIPYRGHFLSKLFLKIRLPKLQKVDGEFVCWTDSLGYALINTAEFEINGGVVDRLYGYFLDMYDEFTTGNLDSGRRNMILKSDVFISTRNNAKEDIELIVPLDFWFSKQLNLSLPLFLINTSKLRVNFNFRKFSELVHWDGTIPPDEPQLDIELFGEYLYVDDTLLDTLGGDRSYLIEQTQFNEIEQIGENISSYISELKFNYNVKEIIFGFVEKGSIDNNDLFNFSRRSDNLSLLQSATLLLDGKERFPNLPESYLRLAFPKSVHSYVPSKYIYCIPFCAKPEMNQPSGSLNFGSYNSIALALKMRNGNDTCKMFTFAVSFNLFKISNGVPYLEYVFT